MKIAIQMDEPHRLNPKGDSTIVLMREAAKRGHTLYYYHPRSLSLRNGEVFAYCHILTILEGENWYKLGEVVPMPLADMDVVLMRQDPPFDMHYITATYLLDRLPASVKVLNHPTAVRSYTEKLLPLDYLEAMPPTLITPHKEEILAFLKEYQDIIIKPLYGWGGHAVLRLRIGGDNHEALLELLFSRDSQPVIAQPFLPEVLNDDVRVVLIGGRIAGAFTRTPASGEIRANMRVGGQPAPYELNAKQHALCERIAPELHAKGLYLAGLDFIGNYLTEINVTSPTGLRTLEVLYDAKPAMLFWDGIYSALKI